MMPSNRQLALIAGAAALLAALAGTPLPPGQAATADPRAAERPGAPTIGNEVSAIELAEWIRDRRGVRLFDLRSRAEHEGFAIPTAFSVTAAELARSALAPGDTVVLHTGTDSPDGDDAAVMLQAIALLRGRGITHVYVLRGGIGEWLTQVLEPTLPEDAPAEQERAFARAAELSRYFGGVPRRTARVADAAPVPATSAGAMTLPTDSIVKQIRRRGC